MAMNISGMAVSGVLVLLFLISFCVQGELWARQALLWAYLGRAFALVISMIVYACTNKIDDILTLVCNALNEFIEYPSCQADLSGTFWIILICYTLVVFLFRLWLARVIYYYYLELKQILSDGEDADAFKVGDDQAEDKLVDGDNTPNTLN